MADKIYRINFEMTDGTTQSVEFTIPQGEKGDTPVKGVDYWTEADKEAIVQEVITALGTPVFGTVDSDNNIILTGNLADGTYTLKYEDAEGEQVEIGTVEIGGVSYTNLLPLAVGCDGQIQRDINGNTLGYADGYYLSGSGSNPWQNMSYVGEDATHFLTGFIPYTKAQAEAGIPIYIKGVTIDTTQSHTRAAGYNTYSDYSTYHDPVKFSTGYITVEELATGYYKLIPTADFVSTMVASTAGSDFQYIRFSFSGSGAGVIITVNEEIEDSGSSEPAYINQIPISIDTDGSIYGADYNGDGVNDGYKEGTRISSSSGSISANDAVDLTGFIRVEMNGIVRMKNVDFKWATVASNGGLHFYAEDKVTKLCSVNSSNYNESTITSTLACQYDADGNLIQFAVKFIGTNTTPYAWMRVCASGITDESIITVNEEITD